MLINLDQKGIAVSRGSACSSGSDKPSYVLEAMGFNSNHISNSLRFSFGKTNKREDIDKVIEVISAIYKNMAPKRKILW